jgi:hypothetical protein
MAEDVVKREKGREKGRKKGREEREAVRPTHRLTR